MADAKLPFFLLCEKKAFCIFGFPINSATAFRGKYFFFPRRKKYYLWGSEGDNYLLSWPLLFPLLPLLLFTPFDPPNVHHFQKKRRRGEKKMPGKDFLGPTNMFFSTSTRKEGGSAIRQTVLVLLFLLKYSTCSSLDQVHPKQEKK